MKTPLSPVIDALSDQNVVVGKARNAFLAKESERKHFESALILAAEGKSHAEKVVRAQATKEWAEFSKALARLESIYEFEKFKLSILDKEYQAQYLEIKENGKQIGRGA
jgi:hypothetical protein